VAHSEIFVLFASVSRKRALLGRGAAVLKAKLPLLEPWRVVVVVVVDGRVHSAYNMFPATISAPPDGCYLHCCLCLLLLLPFCCCLKAAFLPTAFLA
jgi:hypothetical protein